MNLAEIFAASFTNLYKNFTRTGVPMRIAYILNLRLQLHSMKEALAFPEKVYEIVISFRQNPRKINKGRNKGLFRLLFLFLSELPNSRPQQSHNSPIQDSRYGGM